jgi:hypothetical protein
MYEVRRSLVARAILEYGRKNPDAQDTIAGVAEWWLTEVKIKAPLATVKGALADLVDRGLVLRHSGKDAQVHYRINARRLKEIEAVLRKPLI